MYIFCILFVFVFFIARIDNGDETDDWEVKDYGICQIVPLKADSWFQKTLLQIPRCQVAIFQAFKSTYGTEPRFDAYLHTY